jgi:hypothetical protein
LNLQSEILKEHSKKQWNKIVLWVGNDQEKFDELFEYFKSTDNIFAQRSAWPVSYLAEANPTLIDKHFDELIEMLQKEKAHVAVKRSIIRMLQTFQLPEKYEGVVMNFCFAAVQSDVESIAVKAFSITVLENLTKKYPEIIPELKLILASRLPIESAAYKSRANHFLKKNNSP